MTEMAGGGGAPERPVGPPIFVVGCPRSGTTLVRYLLDSHSSISCGPETRFLWGMRGIEERNWSTLVGFGLSLEEWHASVRGIFEAFHLRYAELQGKARWADKSPDYALMLEYVDHLYPHSQIIHIVRDPRDVIDAWRRFYGARSVLRAAKAWVRYVGSAHEFARRQLEHRVLEVKYEDLVRDPEQTLRKLFAWLGEPWEETVLRFYERQHRVAAAPVGHDDRGEGRAISAESIGVGHRLYTAAPFALVRRSGSGLLKDFGYG